MVVSFLWVGGAFWILSGAVLRLVKARAFFFIDSVGVRRPADALTSG